MLAVLGSIFGGGITGVLGSLLTNVLNYFSQSQKNKHDLALKRIDIELADKQKEYMIEEARLGMQTIATKTQGAIDLEEAKAFTESQKGYMQGNLFQESFMDKMLKVKGWTKYITIPIAGLVAFLFGIVDFLKHLMRPGITIVLMGMIIWLYKMVYPVITTTGAFDIIDSGKALVIFNLLVEATIYLTVTCVSWWFSDRQITRAMIKHGFKDNSIK